MLVADLEAEAIELADQRTLEIIDRLMNRPDGPCPKPLALRHYVGTKLLLHRQTKHYRDYGPNMRTEDAIGYLTIKTEERRKTYYDCECICGSCRSQHSAANYRPEVKTRIVDLMVERELTKRTELVDKALARLKELNQDQRKIKPDVETFDDQGNVKDQSYTKAKPEELKKSREKIERLEKAIEKALTDNEFDKLQEAIDKSK